MSLLSFSLPAGPLLLLGTTYACIVPQNRPTENRPGGTLRVGMRIPAKPEGQRTCIAVDTTTGLFGGGERLPTHRRDSRGRGRYGVPLPIVAGER